MCRSIIGGRMAHSTVIWCSRCIWRAGGSNGAGLRFAWMSGGRKWLSGGGMGRWGAELTSSTLCWWRVSAVRRWGVVACLLWYLSLSVCAPLPRLVFRTFVPRNFLLRNNFIFSSHSYVHLHFESHSMGLHPDQIHLECWRTTNCFNVSFCHRKFSDYEMNCFHVGWCLRLMILSVVFIGFDMKAISSCNHSSWRWHNFHCEMLLDLF